MSRVRCLLILAVVVVLGLSLLCTAQAQAAGARGARGGGMMGEPTSLAVLLGREAVQKELKLNEEQIGKVKEALAKVQAEVREQMAGLRDIADAEARRAKRTELMNQLDGKVREQLRDVLAREQMMRLFQIRIQVGGALYALNNPRIAQRLNLTDEQKQKAGELQKATQKKAAEARQGLANVGPEDRRAKMAEIRELTNKADEEALGLLNADQKEAFEKMKGEPFKLPSRRGQ